MTPAFSPVRRAGDLLFLSGQIGVDDSGFVDGGVEGQTRQTLLNIERVLGEHGAALSDVVKSVVYLSAMADWASMNAVYGEVMGQPYPARSAVGSELFPGALVEIDVIAYKPLNDS